MADDEFDEFELRTPAGDRTLYRVPLTPLREMPAAQGPDAQTLEAHLPGSIRHPEDDPVPGPVVEWHDASAQRRRGVPLFAWLALAIAAAMMVSATVLVALSAISGWPWTIVMVMAALVVAATEAAGGLDP